MSKLKSMVAMEMVSMLAAKSEYSGMAIDARNEPTPDWSRKKCKSCSSFKYCAKSNPQQQSCDKYSKRKK